MEKELNKIAAGLLLIGGAVTVPEARRLAGLAPLTESQKRARQKMLAWCQSTGVAMTQTTPERWNWGAFYGDEEDS